MQEVHAKRTEVYPRRSIELAVAQVFGGTIMETAKLLEVSPRAIYKYKRENKDEITALAEIIRPFLTETKAQIKAIAKAEFDAAMEERIGAAVAAIDRGLSSDDRYLDASDRVLDRAVGKVASNLNVKGGVAHLHAHVALPPETVKALSGVIAASGQLYGKAQQFMLPPSQATVDVSAE